LVLASIQGMDLLRDCTSNEAIFQMVREF